MSSSVGFSVNRYRFRQVVFHEFKDYLPNFKDLACYSVTYRETSVQILVKYLGRSLWASGPTFEDAARRVVVSVFFKREWTEGTAKGPVMDVEDLVNTFRKDGKIKVVEGFHPFVIHRPIAKVPCPEMAMVREVLSEHPASAHADKYHRSELKTGSRMTAKLHRLNHEPAHQLTAAIVVEAFLLATLSMPHYGGVQIRTEAADPFAFGDLPLHDTSPGAQPQTHARVTSKKENGLDAVGDIFMDFYEGRVRISPSAVRYKNETLLVEKDGRFIFVANTQYILTELALYQSVVHAPKNMFNGLANNMPVGGNGATMFLSVMGDGMEDPVSELESQGLVYSDVSRSEYGQVPAMKMIFGLILLNSVLPSSFWRYAQASTMANFIYPYVALDGNLCVQAKNLFISGFLSTLWGNTTTYLSAHWWTMFDYYCHMVGICGCVGKCVWGGVRFAHQELCDAMVVLQQGDDHTRRKTENARLIDQVKGNRFGIIFEYEEGPLSQAVFLQKRLRMFRGMPILMSDPERILAKAWHLSGTAADVREGLDSLSLECGDEDVFKVLQKASSVIGRRHVSLRDSDVNPEIKFGRLGGSMIAFELLHQPDHKVVRHVRASRAAAKFGMSVQIASQVFKYK